MYIHVEEDYMYIIFFIYVSIDGHLDGLCILAVVNDAAKKHESEGTSSRS